ncbi:hypothetical protein C5C31_04480 [Rathayibacter rathayi]|uniref:ATP-binding protein n=1 Tax=Rathayibacter rathayi TaxID=33887 RepID=A0ABX5AI23_RATRA|nr:hypothetical protein [Rathayibacter rathayi]AZZ49004.1 hypothetical protein C1O28_07195 [Rathayibacter rathayi]MWV74111.1 hypothetical protein [Rathayibacter rathayi NCPPB 2980 = VKM Ac-1601]PPF25057.1 hypothetical protein C5C34_03835 [Rathayibacter rathayi]PPF51177.1 hypothetical protein C5C08_03590 [Rathayibacter rathayi]PPF82818.1 hypothetical protein C5C14_02740 [Rathayibacter rathayi]
MLEVVLVIALIALVAAVVLWRRTAGNARRAAESRAESSARVVRLELAVGEQEARLRIVGELEQIAVRSAALVVEEAESVRLTIDRDPAAAARSARRAVRAAEASLAQLRRIATVASVDPGDLPRTGGSVSLIDDARERGLRVREESFGEPFVLQDGAEVAVLRVLEYAFDSALATGGPGTEVRISSRWTTTGLRVEVDDDREQHAAAEQDASALDADLRSLTERIDSPALAELRERAALFGGDVTEKRTPGVGRSVTASFPAIRHHNGVHGVDLA